MASKLTRKVLRAGERIKVLVVDDSVVIRRLVAYALSQDPLLEVVGSAANGAIALARIPQTNPDVLTLDLDMPEMDGLETLRRVRKEYPHLRVIIFSTLSERGAAVTFEALTLGADDYVTKTSHAGSLDRSMENLRQELIPKIRQFFIGGEEARTGERPKIRPISPLHIPTLRRLVVAIGVSTGGPAALAEVIPLLPAGFPVPVLVVQHMPPVFTRLLAERLQAHSALTVLEAVQGSVVRKGQVLIAPGDYHMKLRRSVDKVLVELNQGPAENSCRPAVDVLFRSVAEVYGSAALSVILTGMGQDGLRGIEVLKANGAYVIAQDEASSVVWGMPGVVVEAGLADSVVGLDHVAAEIQHQVGIR